MGRVKFSVASHRRKKKVLKAARGQFGSRGRLYRMAKESVAKGMAYAYRDRKQKKRKFRELWIVRINAACDTCGITYGNFMAGLKAAQCLLNRKVLAELALNHKPVFDSLVDVAKKALEK